MAERPDLRQIAASLRESVGVLDREALVEVLTYVLNEYVVEGPPPLAATQVERLEDLAGLSFAGLISALQVRLDVPGLELFRVEGDEVRVQTPSGWIALQPGRAPVASAPERASPPPAAPEGRAGARFVEQPMTRPATPPPAPTGRAAADEALSRGRGDLIGAERGVVTPPAPRPRGLSVSGRPTPTASTAQPPAAPTQPAQAQPAQGQPAQPRQEPAAPQPSSDRKEDDASIRFSLLELD
jgi:hypothetical protein